MANAREEYFPVIDGLRAVAIICVIAYHLNENFLPGGFLGVDIFFVISGYVVSLSLFQRADSSFLTFIPNFYARRLRRILPALLFCLVVTTAYTVLLIPSAWLSDAAQKTGLYAFFGLSNFALMWADPYFSIRPKFNPFTHTWSLGVEEQFYLVFPIIFFLYLRFREIAAPLRLIGISILATLCAASFIATWRLSSVDPQAVFYMMPFRFWELGAGALCFCAQKDFPGLRLPTSFAWIGAALIIGSTLLADQKWSPFPWAVPAVLGAALIIVSGTGDFQRGNFIGKFLEMPILIFLGKISYSLYLWHWSIFVLFRWTVGINDLSHMFVAVLLTFLMSLLSYRFVEQPFRRSAWARSSPNWALIGGALATVVLLFYGARTAFAHQYRLSISNVTRHATDWYPTPSDSAETCGVKWRWEDTGLAMVQGTYRPCDTPQWSGHMFVVGDSHADAYSQMLYMLAENERVDVKIFTHSGCTYANLLNPTVPACMPFLENVTDNILKEAQAGDIVFLASLRVYRLAGQDAEYAKSIPSLKTWQQLPGVLKQRQAGFDQMSGLIAKFAKKGLRIVLDAPKPIFGAVAFRCADWYDRGQTMCREGLALPREGLLELRAPTMDELAKLAAAYPEVSIWDPFSILCQTDICHSFGPEGPLFLDGDHLSNMGNRILYPSFAAFYRQISTMTIAQ